MSESSQQEVPGRWDRFWFTPDSIGRMAFVRGLLSIIAAFYFVSCWGDVGFWYADQGPLSSERVASFLQTSGLTAPARWIVSPLFLSSSVLVYRAYLIAGICLSVLSLTGRGGRAIPWLLWIFVVGWANRAMLLSSLTESALSLGLFATAIAPPGPITAKSLAADRKHWTAGFASRVMGAQVTLLAGATCVTMLAGRVWFNGMGAYALAAPTQNRTIDWTRFAAFRNPLVYESITHLLIFMLPLGLMLAWLPKTNRTGQIILVLWFAAIGALGSHWLYAATMATMVLSIRPHAAALPSSRSAQ
ncbi:MAG: hypothetical protein P1U77_07060 [Rubripirellula sp.]|nr:hypothetical protein [Rubripirellula sp.]